MPLPSRSGSTLDYEGAAVDDSMTGETFLATRFDGRTALAQDVEVRIAGTVLSVVARGGVTLERARIAPRMVSERFIEAPRIVALPRNVMLEIPDADGRLDRTLIAAGVIPGAIQRLQQRWGTALAALVSVIVLTVLAYVYGAPSASRWLAFHLPSGFEQRLGVALLDELDERMLKPSKLPAEQRERIADRFAQAAARVEPDVDVKLEFRSLSGPSGINAFALPGGTIVVLDGLVKLADSDDAVLGVLGHELGHVAGKHSLRQLLQTIGIGALAGLLWGDFSSIVANLPLAYGVLSYSRDFEREADEAAIAFLQENRIPPEPRVTLFGKFEEHEAKRGGRDVPGFLATHPPTADRERRFREAFGIGASTRTP